LLISALHCQRICCIIPLIMVVALHLPKPNMKFVNLPADALDQVSILHRRPIIFPPIVLFPTKAIFCDAINTSL
jgi:hypothetical protein